MSKKQETISDIVAEIRRENPEVFLASPWCYQPMPNKMRSYADRIEAAAKSIEADRDNWRRQALDEDARANAATIKDSLTVGNAAAMRDALEQIRELLSIGGKPDTSMCIRYEAAYQMAKEALSAPPMDCDDLEVCSDYDESDEAIREEREAYEVDKADAKRKGEW